MEWIAIIVSCLSPILTMLGVAFTNAKSSAQTEVKIEMLTEEVKKLNGLHERVSKLEAKVDFFERTLQELKEKVNA